MKTFKFALCQSPHHHLYSQEQGIDFGGRDISAYVPVESLRKCSRCHQYVCDLCTGADSRDNYKAGDEVTCQRCEVGIDAVGDSIYED